MTRDPWSIAGAALLAALVWSAVAHLNAERSLRALEAEPLPPFAHAVRDLKAAMP